MNKSLLKLYRAAQKPARKILGLMSGTSLDGLDMALCHVKGNGLQTQLEVLYYNTIPFNNDFKKEIEKIFSKKVANMEQLTLLNPWVALQHAAIINDQLKEWGIPNEDVDLIASHGQTIFHAPKSLHRKNKFGNATLQIGDGDHLAVATGIITVSDFRQKHIAGGGEGAPLAIYGDYLIFGKEGHDRILLNIGGIANFTFLPRSMNSSAIFSTDTGPGNTIMDAYVQQQFPRKYFDADGTIASQGKINTKLLAALKDNDFFSTAFPKTTGPELFNLGYLQKAKQRSATTAISIEDSMATLNKFTADTIVDALLKATAKNSSYSIFSSGGGMHNPVLMDHLKEALPNFSFTTTAVLGIHPDAKEAVLFAVLANECVCGNGNYIQKNIAGMPAISMGKISLPS